MRLTQGREYIFRVAAENKYGLGEYVQSREILADHPFRWKFIDIYQSLNRAQLESLWYRTPAAPPQPEIEDVYADAMVVNWDPSPHDGGSEITAYHIEKRERNAILWTKISSVPSKKRDHKVTGLTEVNYWKTIGRKKDL